MPKGVYERNQVKAFIPPVTLPDRKQFTKPIHYDEILGIRVLRKGQFRGLWELVRLDDEGKVKQVITDANSRGMVINLATRLILKIVAAM